MSRPAAASPKAVRQKAERRGMRAETWAAWLLRLKGYRILASRYKTPVGEIDLIARRGRTIAFVEVKQRASLVACLEAVGERQRHRIAKAATLYLSHRSGAGESGSHLTARFDLIALAPGQLPRHLADAWRPVEKL